VRRAYWLEHRGIDSREGVEDEMDKVAVLIDAGYVRSVLKKHFHEARIDYGELAAWACQKDELFRAYYYDCLPYQSRSPTPEERDKISKAQSFFSALRRLRRFTVREGRLEFRGVDDEGHPVFEQKRVDLQIGLDIATLALRERIHVFAIISGDSDIIPAVTYAKDLGVLIRLVHGPLRTYHTELWDLADERLEITSEVVIDLIRP
jgi:uncharacterized LabA/DUF88 family protein